MSAKPDETGIHQWLHVDQFPEHLKKYTHPTACIARLTDIIQVLVSAIQDLGEL
jgi:hypothetical protein